MKLVALIVTGAVVGGLIGASQILCPDGQCMITGSWFGGGTVGGLLGFAAAGMFPGRIVVEDEAKDESGDDAPAA